MFEWELVRSCEIRVDMPATFSYSASSGNLSESGHVTTSAWKVDIKSDVSDTSQPSIQVPDDFLRHHEAFWETRVNEAPNRLSARLGLWTVLPYPSPTSTTRRPSMVPCPCLIVNKSRRVEWDGFQPRLRHLGLVSLQHLPHCAAPYLGCRITYVHILLSLQVS